MSRFPRWKGAPWKEAVAALVLGVLTGVPTAPAPAMSPVPFFQQIGHVAILCAADAEPEAAVLAPDTGRLCDLAVEELGRLLGRDGPPVVRLAANDERLADPAGLVVLLHSQTRLIGAGVVGAGTVTALAVTLYRPRQDVGPPPFFIAPPEALPGMAGAPAPEAVRNALHRLLDGAVAAPLRAGHR